MDCASEQIDLAHAETEQFALSPAEVVRDRQQCSKPKTFFGAFRRQLLVFLVFQKALSDIVFRERRKRRNAIYLWRYGILAKLIGALQKRQLTVNGGVAGLGCLTLVHVA
jgi:hypothetical protein